jgi:hypothetical protein
MTNIQSQLSQAHTDFLKNPSNETLRRRLEIISKAYNIFVKKNLGVSSRFLNTGV